MHCWYCKLSLLLYDPFWTRIRNGSLLLHRIRVIRIRIRVNKNKNDNFLTFSQLMRHSLIKLFHLSNLLQMLNDQRMVNVEFFSNFSCSCKRISFSDCSQLVIVNFQWLANALLIFKALISFVKLLELSLHCIFIIGFWTKCIADVVSCLHCFMTHFKLELKNCSNLLFVLCHLCGLE